MYLYWYGKMYAQIATIHLHKNAKEDTAKKLYHHKGSPLDETRQKKKKLSGTLMTCYEQNGYTLLYLRYYMKMALG